MQEASPPAHLLTIPRLVAWAGEQFGNASAVEDGDFCLSFAESSFFPIPPDVLLGPLTLGAPKKWFKFALACSIASVLGGILGYCIGMFLWDQISPWVFAHLGGIGLNPENFQLFQERYDEYDFWIVSHDDTMPY